MNKQLTILGLAAVLVFSGSVALADDRGKRGHKDGHGQKHKNELRRDHRGKDYRRDQRSYRRHFDKQHKRYYSRSWVRPWGISSHYFSSRIGSVVIGTGLSYSFYHRHGNALCHDNHFDNYGHPYRTVGCHRVEYLRDGSQRRVDVPISACR